MSAPDPQSLPLINPGVAQMEKPVPSMTIAPKITGRSKVLQRLAADAASAGAATLLISPVICLIDRSIMENASGKTKSVLESAKNSLKTILTKPHLFFFSKPFALIYMTYFGTYLTANIIDTASSMRKGTNIKAVTTGTEKFVATSATNMSLGLIKDRNFARLFGTGSPRPVPLPTFILFSARDAMTIGFSFNIPPRLTPYIPTNPLMKPESCAQFLAPAACQILSTPMHLLGLDLYNRGEKPGWKQRLQFIKSNYTQSVLARMCRIIPAFGFGGVANAEMRRNLMDMIQKSP